MISGGEKGGYVQRLEVLSWFELCSMGLEEGVRVVFEMEKR